MNQLQDIALHAPDQVHLNYPGSYMDGSRLIDADPLYPAGAILAHMNKAGHEAEWGQQTNARMSAIAADHNIPIEKLMRPRKYWDHEPAITEHNGQYRVLVLCCIPPQGWRYKYQAEAFAQRCRADLDYAQSQGVTPPRWLSDAELADKDMSPLYTGNPLYTGYGDCVLLRDIREHTHALLERSLALEDMYATAADACLARDRNPETDADSLAEIMELGAVLADARATYYAKHNATADLNISKAAVHHLQTQAIANAMNNPGA